MDHPASSQPPHLPRKKSAPGHFRFGRVLSRWWWLAAIVIVGMIATAYKLPDWFKMRGPLYKSTALVQVIPIVDLTGVVTATSPAHSPSPHGHRFMYTQEEIVQASATLERALKKSDLINRLGGAETAALERMKQSTNTRQRRGTDLLEISYRDEDPQLAHDALTAILESYTERRTELEMQLRQDQIKALEVELKNKAKRVQELRQELMSSAEKAGVVWSETESEPTDQLERMKAHNLAEEGLYEARREKEHLQFQLKKLTGLDADELIRIVAFLPNVGFKEVYKTYEEAQESLAALRATGLADNHPSVQQKIKALEEMRTSMEKRAINVRKSLGYKLDLLNSRIKKVNEELNQHQDRGVGRPHRMQQFNANRKEYQTAQKAKDQLQVKHDVEVAKLTVPQTNSIIHEAPKVPTATISKGRDFFTILFTAIAIPCALITAFTLIYLAEAIFPRQLQRSKTASA